MPARLQVAFMMAWVLISSELGYYRYDTEQSGAQKQCTRGASLQGPAVLSLTHTQSTIRRPDFTRAVPCLCGALHTCAHHLWSGK